MKKILHFQTNTLLKDLVGKDLINDDNIAVIELVKNAYDAGSSEVLVKFEGLLSNAPQIVIADHGTGMSLVDIADKWLNIAYSEKKLIAPQAGAYSAGNKGIGRFSCDRLGARLDLLTRKKNGKLLHLEILWPRFEIEGNKDLTIQQIDMEVAEIGNARAVELSGLSEFPAHGTVLVISDLRGEWDRARLLELKGSLEKFLNPNQLFLREKFHIVFAAPEFESSDKGMDYHESVNGEVKNQVFNKLSFKSTYIQSSISTDGKLIKTELFHEGEAVFKLTEKNNAFPLLKSIEVFVYYLSPYKKAYFKRQTGVRSVDFGSVFLFLNGFRVAPYGDRGDDWLGLDVRKTQGQTRYVGSREIVGRIEVSGSEQQFKPISSREGLKKTPAFTQLREEYFIGILRRLEKFVVEGLDWDSVPLSIRDELRKETGLDWNETAEQHAESWERKQQRIALSIMTLIGSSPDRIISFWFNPALLDGVYESRTDEVKGLLAEIEGLDPTQVDANLKSGLTRVRNLITEKEAEAIAAKTESASLRITVAKQSQKLRKLSGEKETYQAQVLFLQSVSSLSAKDLVAFHHQINLDSTVVSNNLAKAAKALRSIPDSKIILEHLEKAALANRRISAVAQFATKANFRAGTRRELTDIPAFFDQYLKNVAKDFVAAGMKLVVENSIREAFEVKVSRVEMSIVIDNIIGNASKALAKKVTVQISKPSKNTVRIAFIDDGKGLSPDLPGIDSMFEMGVTTTSGSGLGLYHSKKIIESIDGKIMATPLSPKGLEIALEITR